MTIKATKQTPTNITLRIKGYDKGQRASTVLKEVKRQYPLYPILVRAKLGGRRNIIELKKK